jgi:hypothetical protein
MTCTALRTALGRLALSTLVASLMASPAAAQQQTPPSGPQWLNADPNKKTNQSNFRGIEEWLAPNEYRTASGSPGPKYWQQQVDYVIKASLDTLEHQVTGSETVTYHNNSPDALTYLWFQLDQNVERTDSAPRSPRVRSPSRWPTCHRRRCAPWGWQARTTTSG